MPRGAIDSYRLLRIEHLRRMRSGGRNRRQCSLQIESPAVLAAGLGRLLGGRDYPHVPWRAPDLHQGQCPGGGFKEVIHWIADRHPTVELLAQSDLNLIARRFKQQSDEPRGCGGHFPLLNWSDDGNVANQRVATKPARIQESPQTGGSPIGWQAHYLAFLVGDDHQGGDGPMKQARVHAIDRSSIGPIPRHSGYEIATI